MFFDILKKDLKRNRTMNFILFLFVIIASIFFASGAYNFVAVMNGTDYMFDIAGVGDYQIITVGENVIGTLDDELDAIGEIKSYAKDTDVYLQEGNVKRTNGEDVDFPNSGLLHSVDRLGIVFFDKDNNPITEVNKGEVWITAAFLRECGFSEGDEIVIDIGGIQRTYLIAGRLKDAFLGSSFVGNTRFVLCDDDFNDFYSEPEILRYHGGENFYIKTDDIKALNSKVSGFDNVNYSYPTSFIKKAYMMNLIVAFIVVILSFCLMIVSGLVLRFSINFSISEDFREIGVMKAIGIKSLKIRALYLIKYVFISLLGSFIGFFISIPFGNMILDTMTEDMVLGSEYGVLNNMTGSVLVALIVTLSAYLSTKRINKLSPIDAVRAGQTGERFKKKKGIRLKNSNLKATSYLALNDVLSSPKRFLTIIISFSLCTLLVLIMENTANTMNSDKLAPAFGPVRDVYISALEDVMRYRFKGKEALLEHFDEMEEEYAKEGMPCEISEIMFYSYQIEFEGEFYAFSVEQALNIKTSEYEASAGDLPKNNNEVCASKQFEELTGAKIGDTIRIDFGNGPEDLLIVGEYQSMNYLGKAILVYEDVNTTFDHLSNPLNYRLKFTDSPDQKTIDERVEKLKELTNNSEIYNATDFCVKQVEVYPIMDAVSKMLLLIVSLVVILITVLMERSFIADEKNEIALVKAVGFSDKTVIKWHVIRFFIVALVSMIIAVLLSVPATEITISPIFGSMGTSDVDFDYDILRCFVAYPLVILAVTVVTATLTALYTKKIVSRDTASIE